MVSAIYVINVVTHTAEQVTKLFVRSLSFLLSLLLAQVSHPGVVVRSVQVPILEPPQFLEVVICQSICIRNACSRSVDELVVVALKKKSLLQQTSRALV